MSSNTIPIALLTITAGILVGLGCKADESAPAKASLLVDHRVPGVAGSHTELVPSPHAPIPQSQPGMATPARNMPLSSPGSPGMPPMPMSGMYPGMPPQGSGPGMSPYVISTKDLAKLSPPTDGTVKSTLSTPLGNRIDLEGVCKISEDSVQCWHEDGKEYSTLAKMMDRQLNAIPKTMPIGFRYGLKNRVAVFRLSTKGTAGQLEHLFITSFGFATVPLVNMQPTTPIPSVGPFVQYIGMLGGFEKGSATASARVAVEQELKPGVDLEPKVGAQGIFDGTTVRILKITRDVTKGAEQPITWTIEFQFDTKHRDLTPNFEFFNQDRWPIQYVSPNGTPVSPRDLNDLQDSQGGRFRGGRRRTYQFIMLRIMPTDKPNVRRLVTDLNPALATKLTISGKLYRTFDMTQIPLDPK